MDLIKSAKIIRKELLIKDEPLKSFCLMSELNEPDLAEELGNSWATVRHCFDYAEHLKAYQDVDASDCEKIEPEEVAVNPAVRYARYEWIVKEMKKNKPKTYLDLGCYVGSLVIYAATQGIQAYGVDLTPKPQVVASDRALKYKVKDKTKFYLEDVTTFNKVKADMVSSFEVFEHIFEDQKYLEHMANLSNGWVYITTPDGPYGDGEGNRLQWEWDGKGVRGHLRTYNVNTLKEMLKNYEVARLSAEKDGLIWVKYRKKK